MVVWLGCQAVLFPLSPPTNSSNDWYHWQYITKPLQRSDDYQQEQRCQDKHDSNGHYQSLPYPVPLPKWRKFGSCSCAPRVRWAVFTKRARETNQMRAAYLQDQSICAATNQEGRHNHTASKQRNNELLPPMQPKCTPVAHFFKVNVLLAAASRHRKPSCCETTSPCVGFKGFKNIARTIFTFHNWKIWVLPSVSSTYPEHLVRTCQIEWPRMNFFCTC